MNQKRLVSLSLDFIQPAQPIGQLLKEKEKNMETIKVNSCDNIFSGLQALEKNFGGSWEQVEIKNRKYVVCAKADDLRIKENAPYIFKWSHHNTCFLGGTLKLSKIKLN